jgi:hypothetical protein
MLIFFASAISFTRKRIMHLSLTLVNLSVSVAGSKVR